MSFTVIKLEKAGKDAVAPVVCEVWERSVFGAIEKCEKKEEKKAEKKWDVNP